MMWNLGSYLFVAVIPTSKCIQRGMRMSSGLILREGNPIYNSQWEKMGNAKTAKIGRGRMNPGMRILPLPNANSLLGGRVSE
jgi:hypothetical protein